MVVIDFHIHEFRNLSHGIIVACLDFIAFLDLIRSRLKTSVNLYKLRTDNHLSVHVHRNICLMILLQLTYRVDRILTGSGRLDRNLAVWHERCIDVRRISV